MADLATVEPIADYAVEIRIRNARILGLMRRAGVNSAVELARRAKSSPQTVGLLINLKMSPLSATTGEYLPVVQRIADALLCHPDDMFTDRQRDSFLASNKRCVEMSEAEVEVQLQALTRLPLDEHIFQLERSEAVQKALDILTPRERAVITARFGLDGGNARTLDETALEVTHADGTPLGRERVRQIETKAIRKLTTPKAGLHDVAGVKKPGGKLDPAEFLAHQKALKQQQEQFASWKEEFDERTHAAQAEREQAEAARASVWAANPPAPSQQKQDEQQRLQKQFTLIDALARWRAGGPAVNPLEWMGR